MKSPKISILSSVLAVSMVASFPGMAQDPNTSGPSPSTGWRRFQTATPPADAPQDATGADPSQGPPPPPTAGAPMPQVAPAQPGPSQLTIPAGTWVTIRVNEPLSSDRNQAGDA